MRLIALLFSVAFLISINSHALIVHIQGQWKNGTGPVMMHYYEDAAAAKPLDLKSTIDPISHRFEFNVDLNHATLVQIADQFFIVLPGDTVNVNITEVGGRPKLSFEGARCMEHSFLIRLIEHAGSFPEPKYSMDKQSILKYKAAVTLHFDTCLLFLKNEVKQQKITQPFETIAQEFLTLQYYTSLLDPIRLNLISKEELPTDYFKAVDLSFFRKTDLIAFREFILAASYYNNHYYSATAPGNPYDSAAAAVKIRSANRNFFGEVKDHLLLSIFTSLAQNGTENNEAQVQMLYDYLTGAFNQLPERVVQLKELKREFDIVDKLLPQEILAQRLKTHKGKFVSLKEVLALNKIVYVDFWASWCNPCIEEIPYEKQLISELEGKEVKFIFISFDDDEKKWQKATSKIKMKGDHYVITEGFKSVIAQYILFNEIPRYLILDKQGRLVSRAAPTPSFILKNKSVLLSLLN